MDMRFCNHCGAPLTLRVPAGDALPRHVCDGCGAVHYLNPKLIAGGIPTAADGRILLCRRGIEPRHGRWTLPAGFMELGETSRAAAERETREEACAELVDAALHSVIDVPQVSQVHLMYRGRLAGDRHAAGAETLETALFHATEIPWDDLAFPSVRLALEAFLADRTRGAWAVHALTVERR
jgi:ADP-ribose pyrophosphatase YjhB (NUDIX family)